MAKNETSEIRWDGASEHYVCLRCGRMIGIDDVGEAPSGWTEREWVYAVKLARDAGQCPECDYEYVRLAGTLRDLVGRGEE